MNIDTIGKEVIKIGISALFCGFWEPEPAPDHVFSRELADQESARENPKMHGTSMNTCAVQQLRVCFLPPARAGSVASRSDGRL